MEYKLFIDKIEDLGVDNTIPGYVRLWRVRCNICKDIYTARAGNIKTRNRTVCESCAPLLNRKSNVPRHEHSLYTTWNLIKRRVDNTDVKKQGKDFHYDDILLCDEWKDFNNFVAWAEINGYTKGLTIDREDSYKGYNPDNCRWVDTCTQAANKKNTNTSTGYVGICLSGRPATPYSVRVQFRGKMYLQKRYKSLKEAVEARNKVIIDNNLPNTLNNYKES